MATINKSLIFADADDLDIWDWVHSGQQSGRIPPSEFGQVPALISERFFRQAIRPIFVVPIPQQVDLEIRPRTLGTDTWGVAGAIMLCIIRRMRESSHNWPDFGTTDRFAYEVTTEDAVEIARLRQRTIAGRLNGVTLPGGCFLHRCGSTFGIRIERDNHPYGRLIRTNKRTHLEDDQVLTDLRKFRTGLESFSHFLADKEVVIHGPCHFRIGTRKEAVLMMTDLILLISGKIRTDRIVESIEPDEDLHSDGERSSIPSWVRDPKSDGESVRSPDNGHILPRIPPTRLPTG